MHKTTRLMALLLMGSIASDASAHTFGAHGAGLAAGLAHPFMGIDHLLAILAVGLWAAKIGGRALWAMPLAFVSFLAGGAGLAIAGISMPYVEIGIATSVLALGLLLASSSQIPLTAGILLSGIFALFHGHAHGAELPEAAAPWQYALGFMCTTLLLHVFGITSGKFLESRMEGLLRICGLAIAATGTYLIVNA